MQEIECAICEKKGNYTTLYNSNFISAHLNKDIFSARRLPDKIHYQIVKCKVCDLVYSNPILEEGKIKDLYVKSDFNYDSQVADLNETYGYYLKELDRFEHLRERLLDIGCGNGFLLEEAKKLGYKEVYGVEPSLDSLVKARSEIRKNIVNDIFKEGLFKKDFFDVVCFFQTFDHIPTPNKFLAEVYKILKPGGLVLSFNHDINSLTAKILKERCPMIDIEHIYLYDKNTMRKIFENNKFKILEVKNSFNIHSLGYWLRMFPFPMVFKKALLNIFTKLKLDKKGIKIWAGNLYLIGQKPF